MAAGSPRRTRAHSASSMPRLDTGASARSRSSSVVVMGVRMGAGGDCAEMGARRRRDRSKRLPYSSKYLNSGYIVEANEGVGRPPGDLVAQAEPAEHGEKRGDLDPGRRSIAKNIGAIPIRFVEPPIRRVERVGLEEGGRDRNVESEAEARLVPRIAAVLRVPTERDHRVDRAIQVFHRGVGDRAAA